MAAAAAESGPMDLATPRKSRVCFSFAAYAKSLIAYLRSLNIPVEVGLSEEEFAAVETTFGFAFPPDLRCILQEGLPSGAGFPNWRNSSREQLGIQMNLPIFGICRRVSRKEFWVESWGRRPDDSDQAARLAEGFTRKAPVLVPVFRHFYIPAAPSSAGNPVFHVHGGVVRLWSFDVASFFRQIEFTTGVANSRSEASGENALPSPAWAATVDRKVEFWTDAAEKKEKNSAARGLCTRELSRFLEDISRRLREGGWKEKDVREMMDNTPSSSSEPLDTELFERRLRTPSSSQK